MRHIGIGIGKDADKVLASIAHLPDEIEVRGYCLPGAVHTHNVPIPVIEDEKADELMVEDLMAGRLDAAVRGTLPANSTLRTLRQATGVPCLERIALLETAEGKKFLLAPVGVDEGWTVSQRLDLIRQGRAIASRLGLAPEVGVLSGGRLGDIGRHPEVDRSLSSGELLSRLGEATHYEIRIEDAIRSCGLIIAPDGISGNLIFRTLTFLGAGKAHGALVVNISRIFVDTSRASPDYRNALMLAYLLSK
jgi:putative methanogen marker protein 4